MFFNNSLKSIGYFVRSKFKPEAPLKVKNSAFCLVSKPTAKKVTVATAAAAAGNKRITRTVLKAQIKSTSQKQRQPLPPPAAAVATVPASVPPPTYSVYNRNKSNEKLMCNILLEKTKCDRIVQQEKGDYELAKMLQEYDDVAVVVAAAKPPAAVVKNGKSTKLNGCTAKRTAAADIDSAMPSTRRYFLRSRSKAETATAAVDESTAAASVDVTTMKRPRPLQNGKVHYKQVLTTTPPRTVGKRKSKSTTRK